MLRTRTARHAAVLVAFVAAAVLGRTTVIDGANLSLVCPAAGVGALWVSLSRPPTRRVAVAGVGVGTALAYLLTGASVEITVLVALANVLQAVVFAALLRRRPLAGLGAEDDVRDLAALAGAAALACLGAAAAGTVVVGLWSGDWDLLGFCVWWGRNSVGMISVALLGLLGLRALDRAPVARPRLGTGVAALGIAAGTFGVYLLVFHVAHGDALAFVVLAPTLVVGLRCRPFAATLHGLLCTALAIGFTMRGEGPFTVVADLTGRALVVQAFVLLTTSVGLALSFTRSHERRVVAQLRASSTRWALLLDSLPDMTVFTLGRSLRVGQVAGAGAWTTGLAGASGRSLASLSSDADLEEVRAMVERALDGERVSTDVRAEGDDREHHVLATALPAAEGHHREVLVVARDVSQERARERAITEARDRAEQLFEDAPHGIAVLDADGAVRRANRALGSLLGSDALDLVGTRLGLRGPEDDLRAHLSEALADPGRTHESTWEVRTSAGRSRIVTLSSRVLASTDPGSAEVLTTVVDVSEQIGLQNRLQHLAHHDPLTGLANRRWFEDRLAQHLGDDGAGALLVVDLDHFKQVNDSLGHAAGDRLLVDLSEQLRAHLGTDDLLARLGGDEFAVLVPGADLAGAERSAARIVRAVAELTGRSAGPESRVTASVGGVLLGGRDVAALLQAADRMLYVAKRRGRNQQVLRGALAEPRSRRTAGLDAVG